MTLALAVRAVASLTTALVVVWVLGAHVPQFLGPGNRVRRVISAIRNEVHPFVLPIVLGHYALAVYVGHSTHPYFNGKATLGLVSGLIMWWLHRKGNDDDDRWRRRGRKAAGSIKIVASGRLAAGSQS